MMDHSVTNLELFAFLPAHKTLYLYSGFIQDEMALVPGRLHFTIGSKIEHNSYTGFEYQPSGQLNWTLTKKQTIWTSVSRALRTPARIDRDFYLFLTPELPFISGNDNFTSEKMTAYELGWRSQPLKTLSFSLASFYNVYDDIRSVEPGPPPFGIPVTFGNGVYGDSYGVELSVTTQLTNWWNLKGGYTFLNKNLKVKKESKDMNEGSAESNDPASQVLIQSRIKLPADIEFGTILRYVDHLPKPFVPHYFGLDVRIGWKLSSALELNLIGQNLLDKRHPEFIPSSPSAREIQRGVYGKITYSL